MSFPCTLGVFTPTVALGGVVGRLVGESMQFFFPGCMNILFTDFLNHLAALTPGGYALMGAAAMSGAITQAVSVSVLVVELTGQSQGFLLVFVCSLSLGERKLTF